MRTIWTELMVPVALLALTLGLGVYAFAVLARARSFMQETGQPFEVALAVTRAGNIFTTHTAVAARAHADLQFPRRPDQFPGQIFQLS